jgi:hypothetical protein
VPRKPNTAGGMPALLRRAFCVTERDLPLGAGLRTGNVTLGGVGGFYSCGLLAVAGDLRPLLEGISGGLEAAGIHGVGGVEAMLDGRYCFHA